MLEAAEGNPLFLEQLATAAAEQGLEPGRVPHTLDALLASRLDRPPAEEREVLEHAASSVGVQSGRRRGVLGE